MIPLFIIPVKEFQRLNSADINLYKKLELIADMSRANTLVSVKQAGSGHLGSSFSAMEIVTWLYHAEMNIRTLSHNDPNRDIYFSSKGHDVPGLYATLYGIGQLSEEKFLKLRRFGGLDGHPDVGIAGIEANSGSLGMGISKGRGIAWAKKHAGFGGHVFVLTGDGEWQEGQNFEALQSTVQQRINNLTVIIDHNKVQSDKLVSDILDLGDLERKFHGFGWHVNRIDGHDYHEIERAIANARKITDRPQIIIADTIKGKGISFMEHPAALLEGKGLYPWHSGAPDDISFERGFNEILNRIQLKLTKLEQSPIELKPVQPEIKRPPASMLAGEPLSQAAQERLSTSVTDEYVSKVFGDTIVQLASERRDLVILDADLASDCKIRRFEENYPDRFIENGIAEQDMVSMAGGLARWGYLPIVNSFASFLAARANEQIYNNASEKTKIIYALHYAGVIPAGPGKSHQSIRDIALLACLPNCIILQPCNGDETRMVVRYCVTDAKENCALRIIIGPSPRKLKLPVDYQLTYGKGVTLREGTDAVMFAYGPVMIHEALTASEILAERGFGLKIINMPWLNRVDQAWLMHEIKPYELVIVLEDHCPVGGLGDHLSTILISHPSRPLSHSRFLKFSVEGWPACGTPQEALEYHKLDGPSLVERVLEASD